MVESLVSQEQKNQFQQNGVVRIESVISKDDIIDLRKTVDAQFAGSGKSSTGYDFEQIAECIWAADRHIDVGDANRFDVDGLAQVIINDPNAKPLLEYDQSAERGSFFFDASNWRKSETIRRVAFDSVLPSLAAELMDSKIVSFWDDTTFVKAPHTRQKTAFHQDLGYNQFDGDQSVVIWVPLDFATLESGVTRYVRGSHRWKSVYAPNMFVSQTTMPGSCGPKCPDIEANEENFDIISFDVKPGDVIIHHVLTVHGAGGNLTDNMRRAMSLHYCGDNTRYFERPGAVPRVKDIATLVAGDRLCSLDHPIVWPRPFPEASISQLYATTLNSRNRPRMQEVA